MIALNYRDSRPIYEQIKDNLRRLILSGGIAPDEKLPSVRELASQLAINPNTIQRAYRELESEGYIYTVAGKGSFAGDLHEIADLRVRELLSQFDALTDRLMGMGQSAETLAQRVRERGGKEK